MTANNAPGQVEPDYAREVTGPGAAVVWETTRPNPTWPVVQQRAARLQWTAMQAPAPGSGEQPAGPALPDDADVFRHRHQARRQVDDVEREVSQEPCDVTVACELVGRLAGAAGVVLLVLRSLSGEGER